MSLGRLGLRTAGVSDPRLEEGLRGSAVDKRGIWMAKIPSSSVESGGREGGRFPVGKCRAFPLIA